jgi:hypothetical protein
MMHKHLYSLLDTSFALVGVEFNQSPLPPGSYTGRIKDARVSPAPWASDELRMSKRGPSLEVDYELDQPRGQVYHYKAPKAWNLEPGDFVVVDSPQGGLKVTRVATVDNAATIDPDAPFDYKWAVQRVDLTEHDRLVEHERRFSDTMLEVERVRLREETMQSFYQRLPEGSEARRMFEQATGMLVAPSPSPMQPPAPGPRPGVDDMAPPKPGEPYGFDEVGGADGTSRTADARKG